MNAFTSLTNLFRSHRSRTTSPRGRRKLGTECLETRRMLAADACEFAGQPGDDLIDDDWINGEKVICVRGTDSADVITIEYDRDNNGNVQYDQIRATVFQLQGWNVATLDSADKSLNNVDRIELQGFGGNDIIVNMTDLDINTIMFGGTGNDQLHSGGGNNVMDGGADNDEYVYQHDYQSLYFNPVHNASHTGAAVEYYFDNLGVDTIAEANGGGDDELNFRDLETGIDLDLADANPQAVAPGVLELTLRTAPNQLSELEDVTGTNYDDVIRGNALANYFSGRSGNDTLIGRAGNDYLHGSSGDDTLEGQGGDDTLIGSINDDTYVFSDEYFSDLGTDTVREYSNQGRDTLDFFGMQVGPNEGGIHLDLNVTGIQDVAYFGSYASFSLGLNLSGTSAELENVQATNGYDLVRGNHLNNEISGHGSVDLIEGRAGDDVLIGGADTDYYVFDNRDAINLGHDEIIEAANIDKDGLDFYFLDRGITLNLASTSRQTVASGVLDLTLSGPSAIEDAYGTNFNDYLYGNGRDNLLNGNDGTDWLYGYAGNDQLNGGADRDHLYGGDHDDAIFGGDGNDNLIGEGGRDTLYGGDGADYLNGDYAGNLYLSDGEVDQLYGYASWSNNDGDRDMFVQHRRYTYTTRGRTSVDAGWEVLVGFNSNEDIRHTYYVA
jgi:Ca2+-binding RTX toxin-like protein